MGKVYYLTAILLFSLLIISSSSNGQDVDSLYRLLNDKNLDQEEQSIICSQLAFYYQLKNADSVLFFGHLGLEMAEQTNFKKGIVLNSIELGDVLMQSDSLNAAKEYLLGATNYFEDYPDQMDIINVWLLLGNLYYVKADFMHAIDADLKGLSVAKKENNKLFMARFYNNLASTQESISDYESAILNNYKAKNLFTEINNEKQLGYAMNNIGRLYIKSNRYDSALVAYEEARIYLERQKDHYGMSNLYANYGDLMIIFDSIARAREYYFLALELVTKMQASGETIFGSYHIINIDAGIGKLLLIEQNYQEALPYLTRSFIAAKKNSLIQLLVPVCRDLAETYEKLGKIDSAFYFSKALTKYSDSLSQTKNERKIAELIYNYKLEVMEEKQKLEKELAFAKQRQKELTYTIIIGAMIVVFLAAFIVIILQRNKMKRNALFRSKTKNELEFKKKQLATNVIYMVQFRELLAYLGKKAKELMKNESAENKIIIREMIFTIEKNYLNEGWKEFETSFQEVRLGFYISLNNKYPNLTPNEQKLCAFLSLNMTTKDISSLTFQSLESIRKARYRLRKKLDITDEENLVSHLVNL